MDRRAYAVIGAVCGVVLLIAAALLVVLVHGAPPDRTPLPVPSGDAQVAPVAPALLSR